MLWHGNVLALLLPWIPWSCTSSYCNKCNQRIRNYTGLLCNKPFYRLYEESYVGLAWSTVSQTWNFLSDGAEGGPVGGPIYDVASVTGMTMQGSLNASLRTFICEMKTGTLCEIYDLRSNRIKNLSTLTCSVDWLEFEWMNNWCPNWWVIFVHKRSILACPIFLFRLELMLL